MHQLAKAIAAGDKPTIQELLAAGNKLESEDLCTAFTSPFNDPNAIDNEIIELLAKHNALPADLSIMTLKFILYIKRNLHISRDEIMGRWSEINVSGCAGLFTPMQLAVHNSYQPVVNFLIDKEVKERPLSYLRDCDQSYFRTGSLLDIDKFKQKMVDLFYHKLSEVDLGRSSEIGAILLQHANDQLVVELNSMKDKDIDKKLMPLFAWLAMKNRVDLLNTDVVAKIIMEHPAIARISLIIAVLFQSAPYIDNLMSVPRLDHVMEAISVAVAARDLDMLKVIFTSLSNHGITWDKLSSHLPLQQLRIGNPLYWTIRCDNAPGMAYLLGQGVDPNEPVGIYLNDKAWEKKPPVFWVIAQNQPELLELLIRNNANMDVTDDEGKKPIDYISDLQLKDKIQRMVAERDKLLSQAAEQPKLPITESLLRFGINATPSQSVDAEPAKDSVSINLQAPDSL